MSNPKNQKTAAKPAAKEDAPKASPADTVGGETKSEIGDLTVKSNDRFAIVDNTAAPKAKPVLADDSEKFDIQDGKFTQVNYK